MAEAKRGAGGGDGKEVRDGSGAEVGGMTQCKQWTMSDSTWCLESMPGVVICRLVLYQADSGTVTSQLSA